VQLVKSERFQQLQGDAVIAGNPRIIHASLSAFVL